MTPMPSRKKEKIGGPGPGPHADSPPTEGRKERERERDRTVEHWGQGKHVCRRVYVHPESNIVVLKAVAQWMSYTRFSLPKTQSKGIGWALKPGDFDRSPCPGERERGVV